ncbi:MAG: MCP four helix bundle domain-containing protein [Bacteroidales bacterium]|nr:MCP four helix bundle domain-containing protein [Bacteroidales bacterium]MCF8458285.1 MCP four helix bundle domain-containing protein [Bacteroidales bacterium]
MIIKRKLKYKLLSGFVLLILMLVVAGVISIIEFTKLSNSVNALIEDNYKTIEASKSMIEALEREDSGVLLLLLGEWDQGREIISAADSSFNKAFEAALQNLTEPHEDEYVQKIGDSYAAFKQAWQKPIVDTDKQGNITWYRNTIHQSFLTTKKNVNALMSLNQESMHAEASRLKDKSHRAIMPGIVTIIAALLFSVMLNFFISRYLVTPILELTEAVKNYKFVNSSLQLNIKSEDEIKTLEMEINKLINKTSV